MKPGIPDFALAAAAALFGVSIAVAQTSPPNLAFANPPHKNLKVLPADIPAPQLIATMKFFAQSLGVRCTFCHAGVDGQPLSTIDFASDAKREKTTARHMMAMVQQINQQNFGVTDLSKAKVTCFTCHRGSPHPQTQIPPPAAAAPAAAVPTAPPHGA